MLVQVVQVEQEDCENKKGLLKKNRHIKRSGCLFSIPY